MGQKKFVRSYWTAEMQPRLHFRTFLGLGRKELETKEQGVRAVSYLALRIPQLVDDLAHRSLTPVFAFRSRFRSAAEVMSSPESVSDSERCCGDPVAEIGGAECEHVSAQNPNSSKIPEKNARGFQRVG